jgi:outer membrane protein assembly factor BamD
MGFSPLITWKASGEMSVRHLVRLRRFFLIACLFAIAAGGLAGCATVDSLLAWAGFGGGTSVAETPESLAMNAMDDYNRGDYHSALKTFEEIKDKFPFSDVAPLAELKAADCNYFMDKFSEALVLYEEFESNHPTNEAMPYVLFQIGMCYYAQINTVDRDPGSAINAVEAFARLQRSFPQSPYYEEVAARIRAARDFLAQHELYVAAFYLRTDEITQAQGRLEHLLANYPETSVAPQAKELLVQVQSGTVPEKSWKRFVPKVSLPDWKTFKSAFGIVPGQVE